MFLLFCENVEKHIRDQLETVLMDTNKTFTEKQTKPSLKIGTANAICG